MFSQTSTSHNFSLPVEFTTTYRYGFNGKEKTSEITGVEGGHYDFGARLYDARLGRWLAVDPKFNKYPDQSPYEYGLDNPIYFIDSDGRVVVDQNGHTVEIAVFNHVSGGYEVAFKFAEGTSQDVKDNFAKNAGTVLQNMSSAETGRKMIQAVADATQCVTINIDNGPAKYFDNSTQQVVNTPNSNTTRLYGTTESKLGDDGNIDNSTITIFQGSIDELKNAPVGKINTLEFPGVGGSPGKTVFASEFTTGEIQGATGTHEITHALDPNSARVLGATAPEDKPNENEFDFYKEVDKANPIDIPRVIE